MNKKELVTTKVAAELLGVSTSTLYRMIDQGIIEPIKTPGGQRRFEVVALDKIKENSKKIEAPQNPYKLKTNNILLDDTEIKEEKPVDKRNTLNDLNGTQWLPQTKSFFYQKGLGAKHPHAQIERQHPAPFSFQDVAQLITFFTKKGMRVLDPFGGIGSTAKACEIEGRICTSIELQQKWHELSIERLNFEVYPGAANNHNFILGDSRDVLKGIEDNSHDFVITSPPYWSILNKKPDHKVNKERIANNLSTNYSDNDSNDLANIENYNEFLKVLVDEVFLECGRIIKPKKYMCLIVSDFRNKSEFISFHSDLIQSLNQRITSDGYKITLQGVKVLIQNHKSLMPYGYPFAYVENIHHQYVLIFRKDIK